MPPAAAATTAAATRVSPGARALQDKLHDLLSRLSKTIEHVKTWPESADAAVHVESTSRLIAFIRDIITALTNVETTVRNDNDLRQTLQSFLIPFDLLELLDATAINPDCYSRGLLKEAMGQFAGLKRRKSALAMLGAAVQKGLDERLAKEKKQAIAAEQKTRTASLVGGATVVCHIHSSTTAAAVTVVGGGEASTSLRKNSRSSNDGTNNGISAAATLEEPPLKKVKPSS